VSVAVAPMRLPRSVFALAHLASDAADYAALAAMLLQLWYVERERADFLRPLVELRDLGINPLAFTMREQDILRALVPPERPVRGDRIRLRVWGFIRRSSEDHNLATHVARLTPKLESMGWTIDRARQLRGNYMLRRLP
jgi:hypothetical protein